MAETVHHLMNSHFTQVAPAYNYLRTTDPEPVLQIVRMLSKETVRRAVDVGCGGGRYSLLLLQSIPGLYLTCIDINEAMLLETGHHLKGRGDFELQLADAESFADRPGQIDCVFSFNAVHHFDPVAFLKQASIALRIGGHVFVYTRLREQNARTLWGRYFPSFVNVERRLYTRSDVESWSRRVPALTLQTISVLHHRRKASLSDLIDRSQGRHYSTLALYEVNQFDVALAGFKANLRRHFPDPDNIRWIDENSLIVFSKTG